MSHIDRIPNGADSRGASQGIRVAAVAAIGLALILGAWWAALHWATAHARNVSDEQAAQIARSQSGLLSSELQKYRLLPLVLTEYPDVAAILEAGDPASASRLNPKLETLAERTNAAVIYVIRNDGRTIAASNWRLRTSFVGQDYSYRPYFREALRDGSAELYALGAVSARPGLFIAQRVMRAGRTIGVVVVKVEFDRLEAVWARQPGPTFVTDANGIILLTSRPEWRFHSLHPLGAAEGARLRATRQYGNLPLEPIGLNFEGHAAWREALGDGPGFRMAIVPSDLKGGELQYLQPLAPALASANATARAVTVAGLALIALVIGFLLRARERAALQAQARGNLEREVALRTSELIEANRLLKEESREREQADERLRSAREELAQANRLGYIGQITTSVAHEINQPVAAIRTFAENAAQFLDRSKTDQVRSNLKTIVDLTGRIGSITAELRSFSRRGARVAGPVAINDVVEGALMLVGDRLRSSGVTLERRGGVRSVSVVADRVRLEQVLINLLQNAAEALEGTDDPRITLSIAAAGGFVTIEIADNGPGVPPGLSDELFAPFVTGRAGGLGLGLGIARDIAREFGGDLLLASSSADGAVFRLRLACA